MSGTDRTADRVGGGRRLVTQIVPLPIVHPGPEGIRTLEPVLTLADGETLSLWHSSASKPSLAGAMGGFTRR